ncbi:MAG: enoyl-CoA hydratase/isomerase family protein [Flavobacteriaceae bacterium]
MSLGQVTVKREAGVSEIEFMHPQGNSFPSALLKHLKEIILEEDAWDQTKVILLRSSGDRAFCAGASFDELLSIQDKVDGKEFFMGFARLINTIIRIETPVIGMVQGKAVGGGVGLAASFDYCHASLNASVKLSELNIGIGPFVIAPVVAHKVGASGLQSLTWDPNSWKSAQWGYEKGLYHALHEDLETLERSARDHAAYLASLSSEALKTFKKASWTDTDHWPNLMEERAEMSGSLVLGPEAKTFLEKFKK